MLNTYNIREGIKLLCQKTLNERDVIESNYIIHATHAKTGEHIEEIVKSNSLLAITDLLIRTTYNYTCNHIYYPDTDRILLRIRNEECRNILVFINGKEPESKATSLDNIFPKPNDVVMVACTQERYQEEYK